jgi:hypothetical protein
MAQEPKFKTQRGTLTAYALACGYIDTRYTKTGYKIELEQSAGCSVYNVKVFDIAGTTRLCWDSYGTLKDARRAQATKAKEHK